MRNKARSQGFRLTKVGAWFLVFLAIVGFAAANTGNNGLYLVLAMMTAMIVLAHLAGIANVRRIEVELSAHGEIFAQRLGRLDLRLRNRKRRLASSLLVVATDLGETDPIAKRRRAAPFLARLLAPGEEIDGQIELMPWRRGRHHLRSVLVESLFPLGFFRKGYRYPVEVDFLVYPEVFSPPSSYPEQAGRSGDRPTRRVGWGHDLFGLRAFRHGDDPRDIHWKQSARTGELVLKQRETEENRRLLIVLDNAVGPLADDAESQRFERLVSEAATAALDYLARGYEVALVTRDEQVDFGAGPRQRRAVLETLSLVETSDRTAAPLVVPGAQAAHLRLAMAPEVRAA